MAYILVNLFGLSSATMTDIIMSGFVGVLLAIMAGMAIDELSQRLSFGVAGNALVLLATMLGGLVVYAQFIQPLRHTPSLSILVIAVASAVTGFLSLSYIKASALRD